MGLAFHTATEAGSYSPVSVYKSLCPRCRHKCCQMNPILCSYASLSPSKHVPLHLGARAANKASARHTPCVGIDRMHCTRLSPHNMWPKCFKRNRKHKSPVKVQRSAVLFKPVLKALLSLPIATQMLLPIPMTTIY